MGAPTPAHIRLLRWYNEAVDRAWEAGRWSLVALMLLVLPAAGGYLLGGLLIDLLLYLGVLPFVWWFEEHTAIDLIQVLFLIPLGVRPADGDPAE